MTSDQQERGRMARFVVPSRYQLFPVASGGARNHGETRQSLLTQLGYPSTSDQVNQRLTYWLPDPMSLILVAEQSGRIVGCLSLHAIPYLERTGRWARIESLVVDELSRGRGTGRSLIAAAEEAARHWNCLTVEVTSARDRADAHAFYERMGYRDICDRSGRFLKVFGDADLSSSSPELRIHQ